MNIQPTRNNIIVLPHKAEETKGGIILSDYTKKRKDSGIIMAVGPLVKDLKVGDIVLHGEFCGQSYSKREIIDGKEMFIMKETDIIAKITGKEKKHDKSKKKPNRHNTNL